MHGAALALAAIDRENTDNAVAHPVVCVTRSLLTLSNRTDTGTSFAVALLTIAFTSGYRAMNSSG